MRWVARLTAIVDPHEAGAPRYRTGLWREAFDRRAQFSALEALEFRHLHRGPRDMVVDRVGSISFIAALPEPTRERVLADVKELLALHVDVRDLAEIAFPYRTYTFVCTAL